MQNSAETNNIISKELIYESERSRVFRASIRNTFNDIIVKQFNKKHPTAEEIDHFTHEYEIGKLLSPLESVSDYQYIQNGNLHYIIMDLFKGIPLNKAINTNTVNLFDGLTIAINIIKAIDQIHQKHVIHKDINPSNILWESTSNSIRIIDFGISSHIPEFTTQTLPYNNIDGTLKFISPEQTGRITLPLDYRTDYYSLGITLYQLFSGTIPFKYTDEIELIHAHIAKNPPPLTSVSQKIPKPVSDIVDKLMAKNPDERYQSAIGILKDLEECLIQFKNNKIIADFKIGTYDLLKEFKLPDSIVGRSHELAILKHNLKLTLSGENKIVLISGKSGIGKTTLANELAKPAISNNAFFFRAQYDRYKKDIPMYGISQALKSFSSEILSLPHKKLNEWKAKLIAIAGPNGNLLNKFIPDLHTIIGSFSASDYIPIHEGQKSLLMIFRNFFKVIADKKHPVVLVLDDFQWSDPLSLELTETIFQNNIPYLMLVLIYRDTEVVDARVVHLKLNELTKKYNVPDLQLKQISEQDIIQFLINTFNQETSFNKSLAKILYSKTNGNPFYIKELLKEFYQRKLIYFNHEINQWDWDESAIQSSGLSENVIKTIEYRISNLSEKCLNALKVASCLGNEFDLLTIAKIMDETLENVLADLNEALRENIILMKGNRINISNNLIESFKSLQFQFQHYRIQKIVYSFVSPSDKRDIHFNIGQQLQTLYAQNPLRISLIEIANHYNIGSEMVKDHSMRLKLAKINLTAAKKALESSSWQSGKIYYKKSIEFLPTDKWNAHYNLSLECLKGLAECEYLAENIVKADTLINELIHHAKNDLDKVSGLKIRTRYYAIKGRPKEAILEGLHALQILGVNIPEKPGPLHILAEIIKVKIRQGRKKTEDLIHLPITTEKRIITVARVLSELGAPAYTLGNDNLYALLSLKVVNLSFKYGYTHELPYALIAYGMLLSEGFGNMKAGNTYGKLAINLSQKHANIEYKSRIIAAYGVLIHHWNNHWKTLTDVFNDGLSAGIHSGDIFYMAHSAANAIIWNPQLNIKTKIREHKKYIENIKESGFEDAKDTAELRLQLLLNFREKTNSKYSLSDDQFDEELRLHSMKERNYISGIAMYNLAKAELHLLHRDAKTSLKYINNTDKYAKAFIGLNYSVMHAVTAFHACSHLIPGEISKRKKTFYLKRMKKELKKVKKWSNHNSTNFAHHYYLMLGEMSKHKKQFQKAIYFYDKAIDHAKMNNWLIDEAFSNEASALFFLENNKNKAASGYINEAFYLYNRLGVNIKTKQLINDYSDHLSIPSKDPHSYHPATPPFNKQESKSTSSYSSIDIQTITKASNAISGEIITKELFKKLLRIIVENAGAQRAILLINQKDTLVIQAEYNTVNETFEVLQSIPLYKFKPIPSSIIHYISNCHEGVILGDAQFQEKFTKDPYIIHHTPKSIMAEPILKQGKLHGIIYLENNLNYHVFKEMHQRVLKILSTQIAISIENSRMFENLDHLVKERTEKLTEANKSLILKNKQIEKQKSDLEKLNLSKDKMFSIIGHDLKGPFNSILRLNEILIENLDNYSNEEIFDIVSTTYNTSNKLYNLLENLLEWARSQSNKIKFAPDLLSFRIILNDVLDLLNQNLLGKEIIIEQQFETHLKIYADKQMIYSILRNLISNAIKYSFAGGKIIISAEKTSNLVNVSIKDYGTGMTINQQKSIFRLGETISIPGTNNEPGTGLGLLICQDFIKKHRGEIRVESEPDKGSTFSFFLPLNISS